MSDRKHSLYGAGSCPAFSSDGALRAAGMGITFFPADVLALILWMVTR